MSELRLHRKLLLQANRQLGCLAPFILRAGKEDGDLADAIESYKQCLSETAARMSEFDVDPPDDPEGD